MKHYFILTLLLCGILFPTVAEANLPITSYFGYREHPTRGDWRFHAGVDLGYAYGTPIPAMFDGIVVQAGNFDDGYGNQVLLYHPTLDAYTRYAHMASISVPVDTEVWQGTILGYVGSTGVATGPHLHLEYIVSDGQGGYQYEDPLVLWQ